MRWVNPGACGVCGWLLDRGPDGLMWCRCTVRRMRATVPDMKLRRFIREWDELGEESSRHDRERQAQGAPPLGALMILAPSLDGP